MTPMSALRLLSAVALLVAVVAGAPQAEQLLADFLTGSPSSSTKAKTSSYYPETQLACLAQTNFKNCRYTGCPVETDFDADCTRDECEGTATACEIAASADCGHCYPDSLYFQTDFTCCGKEHHHYDNYGDREHTDIGSLGFIDKVGTCDWEISMYRSPYGVEMGAGVLDNQEADPWTPHFTDEGSALKWGTAWGTCYLNNNADRCDHPLCERMALTIQGGLYASCAYSQDKPADYGLARFEDYCAGTNPAWWEIGNAGGANDGSNHEDTQFGGESGFKNYLMFVLTRSVRLLGATCSGTSIANYNTVWQAPKVAALGRFDPTFGENRRRLLAESESGVGVRPSGKADGKAQVSDSQHYEHHHEPQTYYPGISLMISGPMSISSKKDGKYETTGMFEQSILFYSNDASTKAAATNYWPVVRARGTKLRFTREQDRYYEAGSQ